MGYQGRKKGKTTNVLFWVDKTGQPLAMAEPQAGHHNDVYEIEAVMEQLCSSLEVAGIPVKGIYMNADEGFDVEELRTVCAEKEIEANIAVNSRTVECLRRGMNHLMKHCIKGDLL